MADQENAPVAAGAHDEDPPQRVNGEVVETSFNGHGTWMPVPKAAPYLGISERTLWRRIDGGKLQKRVVEGRAEVYVPTSGAVPDATATVSGAAPDTTATSLALQEEQTRALADIAGRLALPLERIADMLALAAGPSRDEAKDAVIREQQTKIEALIRENAVLRERQARRLTAWHERLWRWWFGGDVDRQRA